MFTYRKKIRERIKKAEPLTRTKQILEATDLVRRVVKEALEPEEGAPKPPPQPDEPIIEGRYRVVDEPEARSAGTASHEEIEVVINTAPEPEKASAPPKQPPPPQEETAKRAPSEQPAGSGQQSESAASASDFSLPFDLPVDLPDLSDLPESLQRLRKHIPIPQQRPQTGEDDPYEGQFLGRMYTSQAGQRPYKLYIPSSYQPGLTLPLVVMLHGCTQSPDDFAAGTQMNRLAETHNFFVLYPGQTFKANKGKCWNWFKKAEQQRGRGEPAIIAGMTDQIIDSYGLDRRRVYVTGISAGGAMSVVMGSVYPDLFAAIGVHSGIPYAVAGNVPSAFAAMKRAGTVPLDRLKQAPGGEATQRVVPTIVFHGDEDSVVHPENAEQIVTQWLKVWADNRSGPLKPEVTIHRGQVPGGHAYTRSVYHDSAGPSLMEHWLVHGAGHAWSGGSPHGSYTDGQGPDASQEMLRFFYEHPHPTA